MLCLGLHQPTALARDMLVCSAVSLLSMLDLPTWQTSPQAPSAGESGPGPGAYQSEKQYLVSSSTIHQPSYTIGGGRDVHVGEPLGKQCLSSKLPLRLCRQLPWFGDRQSWCTLDTAGQQSPGPSDYNPDAGKLLPHKPAFSLRGKPGGPGHRQRTPGPGHYTARTESKELGPHPAPSAYTFGLKWKGDREADRRPGPNGEGPLTEGCGGGGRHAQPAARCGTAQTCLPEQLLPPWHPWGLKLRLQMPDTPS